MADTATRTPTLPRMSLSSMCRDGHHKTCRDIRARCACPCHSGTTAAGVPVRRSANAEAMAARSRKPAEKPAPLAVVPAGETMPARVKAAKVTGKRPPVIERVREALPPKAVRQAKRKPTYAELVRPILEEILTEGDREWNRVALFFTERGATSSIGRFRKAYSRTMWEWDWAKIEEVNQSAVYVRWTGETGPLI